MVSVLVDNNEVVLHFGLGELMALDRDLGFEVKKVKLGSGLGFLVPKLEEGDVVGLAIMLKAATSRQPYPLKTEAQLESALVYAHETYGSFEAFGKVVIEEMGKHVLTQDLIKKHQKRLSHDDDVSEQNAIVATYDYIVVTCMSTLGIKRLDEINDMTLAEYHYRVFAQEFIELKREYERVKQAFLIRYANATKNVGTKDKPKEEYYFKSEDDILNYKECYYKLWHGEHWGYTQEVEKVSEDDYKLLSVISDINNML